MSMKIGFVGLGKMGTQMVSKLLAAGFSVVVIDRGSEAAQKMKSEGALLATTRTEMKDALGANPIIWLMIPSGAVEEEITEWANILPSGALIIDGGNSDWRLTVARGKRLGEKGIHFMDVGTSGGILGSVNGFSMMIGGDKELYARTIPLFEALAAPHGGQGYMGKTGSGHYVKMIHNGIEYGMMQSFAEGYHLLKEGPMTDIPLPMVAAVWQKGSIINSTLNGLIQEVMDENASLEGVDGYVAESGEGRWTLETGAQSGIPLPALASALAVRKESQEGKTSYATKLLAAMRNKFGGHAINKN